MSRAMTRPAFLASLLLLAACSSGTATSAPTTAAQSQAPASEAPASEAPASEAPASAAPPSAAAGPCAPSDAAGAVSVKIANFAFDPATVTAKVGDVISWTNNDSVQHTATIKSDPSCTTPALATGASGGITFSQAGSYDFFCKIHPQMTGKIEVTS
jgi:plastocyanin